MGPKGRRQGPAIFETVKSNGLYVFFTAEPRSAAFSTSKKKKHELIAVKNKTKN